MSDIRILLYSLIGLGSGIALFASAFQRMKERMLILNTPTSKIRSIAMGHVEVYGEAVADRNNLIKSPFSAQDCLFCKWTIEEYKRSGKSSRWVTIRQGVTGNYFFVKDDTGLVLVDPAGATIEIPHDYQYTGSIDEQKNKTIAKFLKENHVGYQGFIFSKRMRFTEYFIAQGDKVYIMGYAGDNPFVEDGSSVKNETDIMIQKGKSPFYYISDSNEKSILSKYSWKVFGGLVGGGALIVVSLFFIFIYFNIL